MLRKLPFHVCLALWFACGAGGDEIESHIAGAPMVEPADSVPALEFSRTDLGKQHLITQSRPNVGEVAAAFIPVCEIASEPNCLEAAEPPGDYAFVATADLDAWTLDGVADDFVANTTEISQVCVEGSWIDIKMDCDVGRCDCACEGDDVIDCVPVVTDDFRVCVYADAGLSPGAGQSSVPGTWVGCSNATMVRELVATSSSFDRYMIKLTLDNPITGLAEGSIYWMDVMNNTALPLGNTCDYYWAVNGSVAQGGGGNDWSAIQSWWSWEPAFAPAYDLAWCIDGGLDSPDAPVGACCLCDPIGTCLDGVTRLECDQTDGHWYFGETCDTVACPQVPPANDDCLTGIEVVSDGSIPFSNMCATTDGPTEGSYCIPDGVFARDVWFTYTATCTGLVIVHMCYDTDYDSIISIYTDYTDTCQCPSDSELYEQCDDDGCDIPHGPAATMDFAYPGYCYIIRVGGHVGSQGSGYLTINCWDDCTPVATPDPGSVCPPEGCEAGGCGSTSRYVSFHVGESYSEAARVKFVSLPGYEYAEARKMWVQEPYLVTETAGSPGPEPPPTMWAARLGCGPFYTDWSIYDVVDVFDDAMVPGGVYNVQLISSNHSPYSHCYSDPYTVTLSELGDVVGNRTSPPPMSPPQCVCDFNDISAIVDKFKGLPTAPRKARADVMNSDITQPTPDQVVDFVDISCAVECFRGVPCTVPGPPIDDPC